MEIESTGNALDREETSVEQWLNLANLINEWKAGINASLAVKIFVDTDDERQELEKYIASMTDRSKAERMRECVGQSLPELEKELRKAMVAEVKGTKKRKAGAFVKKVHTATSVFM